MIRIWLYRKLFSNGLAYRSPFWWAVAEWMKRGLSFWVDGKGQVHNDQP